MLFNEAEEVAIEFLAAHADGLDDFGDGFALLVLELTRKVCRAIRGKITICPIFVPVTRFPIGSGQLRSSMDSREPIISAYCGTCSGSNIHCLAFIAV